MPARTVVMGVTKVGRLTAIDARILHEFNTMIHRQNWTNMNGSSVPGPKQRINGLVQF